MRKVLTTLALAGAGAFLSALLVASPAQAAHHSNVAAQAKHFAECLDLMISNPTKHAQLCGPGHEWTGKFSSEGALGPDAVVPPTVTEEPCEKPPCEKPPCYKPPCEEVVSTFSITTDTNSGGHHWHRG